MKSYLYGCLIFVVATGLLPGCKKYLDVNNVNPNTPTHVSESLLLGPAEKTTANNTISGFVGLASAYWTQQLSINNVSPSLETYEIFPEDVDYTWSNELYPAIFQNLKVMIAQAEAAHHNQYAAIGKTLYAFNLAVATDLWNEVPYSQANNLTVYPKPKYDSQESVYHGIQLLLDSALYYAALPPSTVAPTTDDYIYAGDMGEWTKLIYVLKARYYMRLTKAPGHTAVAQADSALTALQNGFQSNSDNAGISFSGAANDQNPWYVATLPYEGGVVLADFLVGGLTARNDPRLPIIANPNNAGAYIGRLSGADPTPDYTAYSTLGPFFGGSLPLDPGNTTGTSVALVVSTYSEALFLKAEATLITQGAGAANAVYRSAITADMAFLGVAAASQNTYLAARPALTTTTALQSIINEKYIADLLSLEAYNDWRRTGYPAITIAQNAYVPYIPRRWPYPSTELQANPQPQQNVTTADRVWWDAQ